MSKKYDTDAVQETGGASWTTLFVCVGLVVVALILMAIEGMDRAPSYRPEREPWFGLIVLAAVTLVFVGGLAMVVLYRVLLWAAERTHDFGKKRRLDAIEVEQRRNRIRTDDLAEKLSSAHISADGALVREVAGGWQVVNLSAEVGSILMGDNGNVHRALHDDLSVAQIAAHFDVRKEDARSRAFPNLHTYHSLHKNDQVPAIAAPQAEQDAALPKVVRLHDLAPRPSLSNLVLGVTINDSGQQETVTVSLQEMVHALVAGRPNSGKSVFLRVLAYQLAVSQEPCRLALFDMRRVTFAPFANSERLLWPVASTPEGAAAIARDLEQEMSRREELYLSLSPGIDNLADYNARAREALPPIVFLMDEATILLVSNNGVMQSTFRAVLEARKFGIYFILGGQSWKGSHIDTGLREMLAARFQFRTAVGQSRMVIGDASAATIEVPGRAMAQLPHWGTIRLQAPLVEPSEILSALQGQGGPLGAMPTTSQGNGQEGNDKDAEIDAQILALHAQGKSKRAIQREVWPDDKSSGGAHFERITRVIGEGRE
ncbi:MAG: hypothetical protein EHM35_00150 [Planctomycetaceae bacterium]|nr:MAG: hypothetical protein EHM35_00150 [Planctomycetaceae bacterium]